MASPFQKKGANMPESLIDKAFDVREHLEKLTPANGKNRLRHPEKLNQGGQL